MVTAAVTAATAVVVGTAAVTAVTAVAATVKNAPKRWADRQLRRSVNAHIRREPC